MKTAIVAFLLLIALLQVGRAQMPGEHPIPGQTPLRQALTPVEIKKAPPTPGQRPRPLQAEPAAPIAEPAPGIPDESATPQAGPSGIEMPSEPPTGSTRPVPKPKPKNPSKSLKQGGGVRWEKK